MHSRSPAQPPRLDGRDRAVESASPWPAVALIVLAVLLLLLIIVVGVGVWIGVDRGWFGNQGGTARDAGGASAESAPDTNAPKPDPASTSGKSNEEAETDAESKSSVDIAPESPPEKPAHTSEPQPESPAPEPNPQDSKDANDAQSVAASGSGRDEGGPTVGGGSFFGLRADGSRFVYVVDCSGSMSGEPFKRAMEELVTSLADLAESKQFFVILFSTDSYPMFHPETSSKFQKATDDSLKQVRAWLREFSEGGGGTNPEPSLVQALSMAPDAIFFLSDGAVPASTAETVRTNNSKKIPVHTVGFTNRAGEAVLKRIAEENRGQYKFVH